MAKSALSSLFDDANLFRLPDEHFENRNLERNSWLAHLFLNYIGIQSSHFRTT
jgi:hypothetical protein